MIVREAVGLFLLAGRADGLSPRTVRAYRDRLSRLELALGGVDLGEVSASALREYVVGLRDSSGLAASSVRGCIQSLRRLFAWCLAEGLLAVDPAARLRLGPVPDVAPKAISIEDARLMVAAAGRASSAWERARDVALLLVLIDTGCRLGGLAGLRLGDVDLERRSGRVVEKGGRWRAFYLDPVTVAALRAWLVVRAGLVGEAEPALWVGRRRCALTAAGIQVLLRRVARAAGVSHGGGAHSFRHRFAISYLVAGGDLASLADLLGHRDVAVTARSYARFEAGQLQTLHDRNSPVGEIVGAEVELPAGAQTI